MAVCAQEIKELAHACGFELAGVTAAVPSGDFARFEVWRGAGMAGEMSYMTDRRGDLRCAAVLLRTATAVLRSANAVLRTEHTLLRSAAAVLLCAAALQHTGVLPAAKLQPDDSVVPAAGRERPATAALRALERCATVRIVSTRRQFRTTGGAADIRPGTAGRQLRASCTALRRAARRFQHAWVSLAGKRHLRPE